MKYHLPGTAVALLFALAIALVSGACQPGATATTAPAIAASATAAVAFVPTDEPFYAPDFSLKTPDETTVTLSDLRGQWVIVNFWATWCIPCVEEMPALQQIADENADQLTLIGINMRDDVEDVLDFITNHAIRFPILVNPDDETLLAYNVTGLPQTVIIDPDGAIVDRSFGPVELATFRARLAGHIATYQAG